MPTITIPRKLTKGEELVAIPRREYERFLSLEESIKKEKKMVDLAIEEGLRDLRAGRVSPVFSSSKIAIRYLHRQAKKFKHPQ